VLIDCWAWNVRLGIHIGGIYGYDESLVARGLSFHIWFVFISLMTGVLVHMKTCFG